MKNPPAHDGQSEVARRRTGAAVDTGDAAFGAPRATARSAWIAQRTLGNRALLARADRSALREQTIHRPQGIAEIVQRAGRRPRNGDNRLGATPSVDLFFRSSTGGQILQRGWPWSKNKDEKEKEKEKKKDKQENRNRMNDGGAQPAYSQWGGGGRPPKPMPIPPQNGSPQQGAAQPAYSQWGGGGRPPKPMPIPPQNGSPQQGAAQPAYSQWGGGGRPPKPMPIPPQNGSPQQGAAQPAYSQWGGGGRPPKPMPIPPQNGNAQQGAAQPRPLPQLPLQGAVAQGVTPQVAAVVNDVVGQEVVKPQVSVVTTVDASAKGPGDAAKIEAAKQRIKQTYAIDLNNEAGIRAANMKYAKAKFSNPLKLEGREWTLPELEALEEMLALYAPILGAARAGSTMADMPQPLTTISRVNMGMDLGAAGGAIPSPTTMGESFSDAGNVSYYDSMLKDESAFKGDIPKSMRRIIAHELNHALNQPVYFTSFLLAFGDYWRDLKTRVNGGNLAAPPGVEAPITRYGTMNVLEDFAETAGFFFSDRSVLQNGHPETNPTKTPGEPGNPAPRRLAFMERIVAEWTSPKLKEFCKYADLLKKAIITNSAFTMVEAAYDLSKLSFAVLSPDEQQRFAALMNEADMNFLAYIKIQMQRNAAAQQGQGTT